MAEFDLSSLPDLVLEKVFKMLPVSDRGRLASCNWKLARLMDTPNVWKEVSIDEFDLHLQHFDPRTPRFPQGRRCVDQLCDRDFSMIEKYGQHFKKVKVVMQTGLIESQSLAVLTRLCKRKVIKSVSLRLDRLLSKMMNWKAENLPVTESFLMKTFFDHRVIASPETGPGTEPPASHFIDYWCPNADFTIVLPPQSHNIEDFFEQGFDSFLRVCYLSVDRHYRHESDKCRSSLKKLMLSPLLFPEEVIAREWMKDVQLPQPPTAHLISSFPNLQELHVNIVNLSDQLLRELSGAKGRQKPLRSLVIRHIVCDCQMQHMLETCVHLLAISICRNLVRFPQLSSAAWTQLAQFSPSLTVECSVVSNKLPLLLDVIKPETPLVRLEVLCGTTSGDDQSVSVLQELSENHSHLTIVGVRFRACTCTDADS